MLAAVNQVIERNIEHLPAGNVLLVDFPDDSALTEFSQQREDITWFGYTPYFTHAEKHTHNTFFTPWLTKETVQTEFDAVIIYYPKTKLRFDFYLSMVSKLLHADATIYVVGEKKGGVKSCEKQIKSVAVKAHKLDAARHCQMYWAAFNEQVCSKNLDDWFENFTVNIDIDQKSVEINLFTLPGVFSGKQLDEGSELLLSSMNKVSGHGLDFGCGCGVISAAVSKAFDVQLTAVDVDTLAVASANKTFQENDINATAIESNGLSVLTNKKKSKFDFIVTNPPFHTGLKTDYDVTETLIKNSKQVLKPKYQYWMVANSFLQYPQIFNKYLKPVVIKNTNKRFNIYHLDASI